jgi:hypothetical protein
LYGRVAVGCGYVHDVLVNAIEAGWFGVVSVNVFSQDIVVDEEMTTTSSSWTKGLPSGDNWTGSMVASQQAFHVWLLFQYAILQIR